MNSLWAITVALSHESKGILPLMSVQSQTQYRNIRLFEGSLGKRDCVLMQTGMGPKNAEAATRFLLKQFPVTHLVSTGYCGALVPEIQSGEVVLCPRVRCREDGFQSVSSEASLFQEIKERLEKKKIFFHTGDLITSPRPVLKADEKRTLGKESQALAVDMESYFVLKAAQEEDKKIASLALRFVVDALADDLTDTGAFVDPGTGLQALNLIRSAIRKPKILLELPGLERMAARARKGLEQSMAAIFSL